MSELIAELQRAGLLLNNLFQLDNGMWRASVRSITVDVGFSFYDHPNPGAAIRGAIAQKDYSPLRKNKARTFAAKPEKISGADLLKKLGL